MVWSGKASPLGRKDVYVSVGDEFVVPAYYKFGGGAWPVVIAVFAGAAKGVFALELDKRSGDRINAREDTWDL